MQGDFVREFWRLLGRLFYAIEKRLVQQSSLPASGIGSLEELDAARWQTFAFFKTFYSPNATLDRGATRRQAVDGGLKVLGRVPKTRSNDASCECKEPTWLSSALRSLAQSAAAAVASLIDPQWQEMSLRTARSISIQAPENLTLYQSCLPEASAQEALRTRISAKTQSVCSGAILASGSSRQKRAGSA